MTKSEEYRKGYESLTAFVQGMTVSAARHCLVGREVSIDCTHPFNKGGNAAVKDYIAQLEESTKS